MDRNEFNVDAIQLAYVVVMCIDRLTALYGSYEGWIRQAGRPLNGTFLSDDEINQIFNGRWHTARVRALFFWAGLSLEGASSEIVGWHVAAIQWVYRNPEAWNVGR